MKPKKIEICFLLLECDRDPAEITAAINLEDYKIISKGEVNPYTGKTAQKNQVIYGYNDVPIPDDNDMIMETLKDLIPKEDIICSLKDKLSLDISLYVGEGFEDILFILDGPVCTFLYNVGVKCEFMYF